MRTGEVRFSEAWYSADEDAGPATLSLEDTGDELLVHWDTQDGMVIVGLDSFLQSLGSLRLMLED